MATRFCSFYKLTFATRHPNRLLSPLQTTRRRPLSSLGGSATKQKPAKRARKSMGRRVSFAPDQRLEQTHFYERVRQCNCVTPAPGRLHTWNPHCFLAGAEHWQTAAHTWFRARDRHCRADLRLHTLQETASSPLPYKDLEAMAARVNGPAGDGVAAETIDQAPALVPPPPPPGAVRQPAAWIWS